MEPCNRKMHVYVLVAICFPPNTSGDRNFIRTALFTRSPSKHQEQNDNKDKNACNPRPWLHVPGLCFCCCAGGSCGVLRRDIRAVLRKAYDLPEGQYN